MALVPGARIGVYEVTAPIGQGGMGQVYRATDTTLGRHVAIKVLPDAFAADTDRLARFEREAKTLASLNHPHIAAIYGFEKSAGAHALVMELVEGEDLSQRIARGAMPLDEAVPIATQIAEALEAAHEQGIVHRDLKPANIKVRADGTVKVLDFGLAKAMAPSPGSSTNLSMSPTITTPALTQAGMILGTAAYLSPEQAKGRPADQRSDLWAFGCVLFEMLTGACAFPGDDVGDTLAAVLRAEPEWRALPADTPASIRRLLRRCLEKDRKRRLSTAADARLEIEDALTPAAFDLPPTATTGSPRAWWQRALGAAIAFIVGGAISGSAVWLAMRPGPIRVTRTTIETSGATALVVRSGAGGSLAITPDGSRVVYTSAGQLVVRRLDQFEPTLLTGLGTPVAPFISPDGQWVGFFDGPTLKKVSIDGGPPTTLVEGTYAGSGGAMGATWSADDTIVFATTATRGLRRVSAAGGDVETLTTPDRTRGEVRHSWPELLPGGRSLLLTITRTAEHRSASDIAELDLTTGTHRVLISGGSRARYLPTGHLVYAGAVRGDTKGQLADYVLRVVAFDVERQAVAGTPVPMVALDRSAAGGDRARVTEFHIAANGTLVYYAASDVRIPVWVDRQGRETPLGAPARTYFHPRLAPDGRRVVLLNDTDRGLWTWDVGRAMLTRAVLEAGGILPLWTPDGRSFVMSANPPGGSGRANLFQRATDGTGTTRRLTDSPNVQHPTGITPDGTHVVFYESTPTQQRDIRLLTLADAQTRPLVETPSDEGGGVVSPDGRWLAYESNRTGPHEIYVRPFPRVDDGVWQVSTAGGVQPLWSRSELFYVATDGALMAVAVEPRGAVWSSGAPLRLFAGRYFRGGGGWIGTRQYDVSTDGQRFLMLKEEAPDANQASSINVVQSWLEEVKRLVTTK